MLKACPSHAPTLSASHTSLFRGSSLVISWQLTPVFLPRESPWTAACQAPLSTGFPGVGHNWATKQQIISTHVLLVKSHSQGQSPSDEAVAPPTLQGNTKRPHEQRKGMRNANPTYSIHTALNHSDESITSLFCWAGFSGTCNAQSADPDSQQVSEFLATLTHVFISLSEAPGRLSKRNLSWWKISDRWQQLRGWNSRIQALLGSQSGVWALALSCEHKHQRIEPEAKATLN